MSVFGWCSRRVGGLSMLAVVFLSYWVISKESVRERHGYKFEHPDTHSTAYSSTSTTGAGIWTYIFAYYTLFLHAAVLCFPVRALYAIVDLTRAITRPSPSRSLKDYKSQALRRRGSYASVSSSETLISEHNGSSSTAASSEAGDFDLERYHDDGEHSTADPVIHAIVIPNYKEEIDSLKETLEVLASHPQAHNSYDIYLGMEQREQGGEAKALALIEEFAKKFRSIDYTVHPGDIPGEAAGKGSNMAWAARKLSVKYPIESRKNVVVTGIDADSHLSRNYFAQLTDMHLSYPETAPTTLYSAPIIFDRNAHAVPAVVRVADILWTAGGMSGLYRGSTIAPPTSVYSMSLELIDRVGGWDCGCEAIGEDLHMFVKSFFTLNGNLTCRTIVAPVSQSNVVGSGKGGIRGMFIDMQARYNQALRHMWGSLDTGYGMRRFVEMWQNRKRTTRAFRPVHRSHGENSELYYPDNHLSDEASSQARESGVFSDVTQETIKEVDWERVFYMSHRLFEAHIMPVHMTVLIIASTLYMFVTDGKEDPHGLNWTFALSNTLRTIGVMLCACYIAMYERFHRLCVDAREKEMKEAGLAEGMNFSRRSFKKNCLDYIMVPLVAPLYGSIPCIQAEICHFWTLDLVYTVSKKVTRQPQTPRTDAFADNMA
ncbi:unnamed protein product [Clonostachys solani]|uniref:Glycosyltransferase 2-like domain-containing protein n=1 Tax=Clonostachys solani TaxID=160281 RepID=A0A9P0EJT0_9HYPO|nr:unnamed protein product [Clonostachys solani]